MKMHNEQKQQKKDHAWWIVLVIGLIGLAVFIYLALASLHAMGCAFLFNLPDECK